VITKKQVWGHVTSRGPGGFRKVWEAGRNHLHLSWYLSDAVVTSYGQELWGDVLLSSTVIRHHEGAKRCHYIGQKSSSRHPRPAVRSHANSRCFNIVVVKFRKSVYNTYYMKTCINPLYINPVREQQL